MALRSTKPRPRTLEGAALRLVVCRIGLMHDDELFEIAIQCFEVAVGVGSLYGEAVHIHAIGEAVAVIVVAIPSDVVYTEGVGSAVSGDGFEEATCDAKHLYLNVHSLPCKVMLELKFGGSGKRVGVIEYVRKRNCAAVRHDEVYLVGS